jgi:hypothetical protein
MLAVHGCPVQKCKLCVSAEQNPQLSNHAFLTFILRIALTGLGNLGRTPSCSTSLPDGLASSCPCIDTNVWLHRCNRHCIAANNDDNELVSLIRDKEKPATDQVFALSQAPASPSCTLLATPATTASATRTESATSPRTSTTSEQSRESNARLEKQHEKVSWTS